MRQQLQQLKSKLHALGPIGVISVMAPFHMVFAIAANIAFMFFTHYHFSIFSILRLGTLVVATAVQGMLIRILFKNRRNFKLNSVSHLAAIYSAIVTVVVAMYNVPTGYTAYRFAYFVNLAITTITAGCGLYLIYANIRARQKRGEENTSILDGEEQQTTQVNYQYPSMVNEAPAQVPTVHAQVPAELIVHQPPQVPQQAVPVVSQQPQVTQYYPTPTPVPTPMYRAQPPQVPVPAPTNMMYLTELDLLHDMNFNNDTRNLQLLVENQGDLRKVVEVLLEEQSN